MEKTKIGQAFSRAARAYDTLAVFQRHVCDRMLCLLPEWLPEGRVPKRLLDAGCGTGFGAQSLSCLWPDISLMGCDIADEMVARMRQKGFKAVKGDLENLPFENGQFDFVWSSLALQWCRPNRVFTELHRVLEKDGILYFSTLAPGTLPEIAYAFEVLDGVSRVREFSPVSVLQSHLHQAGFSDIRLICETHKRYFPDVRSALESIRGIGAGYTSGTRRTLFGKSAWQSVQERYEALREKDGLPLTYELVIGYGKACG